MVAPEGIGLMLRTIRERNKLSREQQADLMSARLAEPFCPDNLKRWETEKRLPVSRYHQAISDVYGVTLADVRKAVAASSRHRKLNGQEEDDVKRRNLLGAATAAVTGSLIPGIAHAREGIDGALTGHGNADVEYLITALERHRDGYKGRTPDAFLHDVSGDLIALQHALNRPHPAATRTELARTTAGLAGLVAIVQHDRGDQLDSYQWFATAERAARECGDRKMAAWVLARHAMVPLNYGAPATAARLAAQARRAAGRAPCAAGALAAAVTARSLAALGDRRGATAAIADTRNLIAYLDGPDTADTWFGYPAQKHHVHLSQAYTLLGHTREAHQAQDDALTLTTSPSVMTRALLAVDRATCLSQTGDHTTAAELAATTLTNLPPQYRHGLIRTRTEKLLHALPDRPRRVLQDALG
ncbi:transcriptional regulator [Streptomyces bambusae]|uniref:transcriptional regulator n=1 Tax=Streptomyces bambusae TaxID=1550616 RepID=UPI001CFFA9E6|nr:transcriptional regulator [Streptomyces bambusae]MCB5169924.1 transcriptional regulator [Streptomyces bambusae]